MSKLYVCWVRYWDDSVVYYHTSKTEVNAQAKSIRQRGDDKVREAGYITVSSDTPITSKDRSVVYSSSLGAA